MGLNGNGNNAAWKGLREKGPLQLSKCLREPQNNNSKNEKKTPRIVRVII